MIQKIECERMSRRSAFRLAGLAAAFGVVAPAMASDAEAQTTGMERRQDRRTDRHERREDRRTDRQDRREDRRSGGSATTGSGTGTK